MARLVPPLSVAVGASKVQAAPSWTVLLVLLQVMIGAMVSMTLTVWLHWALLPQLSVALGASKVQAAPSWTVLLVLLQLMTGAMVSMTLTVWLHWALLPQASVAAQVRVASKVLPQ